MKIHKKHCQLEKYLGAFSDNPHHIARLGILMCIKHLSSAKQTYKHESTSVSMVYAFITHHHDQTQIH